MKIVILVSFFSYLGIYNASNFQQKNIENVGILTNFVACTFENDTIQAYIIQYHLNILSNESYLLPDSLLTFEAWYIASNGDIVFTAEPIDARYLLGYGLGFSIIKCPNSSYPRVDRSKGKDFWFAHTYPIRKDQDVKSIHFKLWANIHIAGEISLREFNTITKIE